MKYAVLSCTVLFLVIVIVFYNYISFITTPVTLQEEVFLTIEPGSSAISIASLLYQSDVITSELFFKLYLRVSDTSSSLKAGKYLFSEPKTPIQVIEKLMDGAVVNEAVTITFVEGQRVRSFAGLAEQRLDDFSKEIFIDIAEHYEGRLFPDTYFLRPATTEQELLEILKNRFNEKVAEVIQEDFFLTFDEVIILASILEREANSDESKRMVSGVLQNRLKINMPLQADASIEYVLEKPLGELLPEDLRIDSPYNTYLNTGLPPTPIGNPGLVAINAVYNPIESDYFFYITGRDGNFYYAVDFDEHRRNISRYLR